MPSPSQQIQAARHWHRTRLLAAAMLGAFIATLSLPAIYHAWREPIGPMAARWIAIARSQPIDQSARLIEQDFNQRFIPAQTARTLVNGVPIANVAFHGPGVCTVGRDGFIFLTEDVRVQTAGFFSDTTDRGRRAADAIADLASQLQQRGVHLLVVPLPAKASIYPEFLDDAYDLANGPKLNPDHAAWMQSLRVSGVDVLDLSDVLWQAKQTGPVFFKRDTHWTQSAMRAAAPVLAKQLRSRVALPPPAVFALQWMQSRPSIDLLPLLDPWTKAKPLNERETVLQLVDAAGNPLRPADDAPVLLLGDSFSALFDEQRESFAQVLTWSLGTPVQSGAKIGADGDGMRLEPHLLRNKKAVVLVFSIRQILLADWHRVPIAPSP